MARLRTVELNLARNEELTLTDSTRPEAWQLFADSGQKVVLPAILVTLPPPNSEAKSAIEDLEIGIKTVEVEWDCAKANCAYYLASGRFNDTANKILEWDSLPPINARSSALSALETAHLEAGRYVDDSKNQVCCTKHSLHRLSSKIQISRCIIFVEKRKSTFCSEFFRDQEFFFENFKNSNK